MELKSKIQKLHEIDTSKELVITRLMADRNMIEAHRKRLSDLFKNDTPEQINNKVNNIIVRNNVFNAAMNEIIKAYQVTFDSEEVNNTISRIKPQFPTATEDNLKGLAQRVILKALVFQDLVQAWSITVSDEEAKESLQKYYMFSNEPIKQYLDDPIKFNGVKNVLLEEKIATEILKKFKHRLDLKPVTPTAPQTANPNTDKPKTN